LERSDIVFEFLDLIGRTALLPVPTRRLQRSLVRAAVAIIPPEVRAVLGLGRAWDLGPIEARLVSWAGRATDRLAVEGTPAVEACRRLGLAGDYLYRR
jgi:uncharacterized protein (DUF2236 family)